MKGGGAFGGVRFESQRFRLLSIVVGCFIISVTFLLSSRPEAAAFDALTSKAWLTPTSKTVRSSSGLGRDFLVDILPQEGEGDGESHGGQPRPRQSAAGDGEKTDAEWVKDTVIIEERSSGDARPEQEEENDAGAGASADAGTDHHGDKAASAGAAEVVHDYAVPATTTTTQPDHPGEEEEKEEERVGGGARTMKLQLAEPATEKTTVPAHDSGDRRRQPLPPLCDFSDFRSDVCDFTGDIRMDANASAFVVVVGEDVEVNGGGGQSHRVRPYPRKGDETCMGRVTEIAVRTSSSSAAAGRDQPPPPRCTRTHDVPAVAFSIGGYTGNIFHDFSDVIVPLFNTVRRFRGHVQLVMANVAPWWLIKYDKLLRELTLHAPINLAEAGAGGEVHCFRHAVVSLRAHRELIIERERSLDGLATPDFTRFLRGALSLPRDAPTRLGDGTGRKPRLLIISRRRTRILTNLAAVVRAAEEAGFEAVVNESDVGNDISEVGRLINSCDVLVGVHGAGLTNMMFLPPGATMVQVVPWGGLQWIARMDYGDPAEAMGLRYIQYEIAVDESSLKDKYPAGHEIFTNPTALHKKGFGFMRQTLMDGQDITVDVHRFKPVLFQALATYLAH